MSFHEADQFSEFYKTHATKVRGLLFRLVGEAVLNDLTQEAFLKAWENRHRFRGDSEAYTWLYRITYNCAVDYLRKNKGAIDLEVNDLDERLEQDISNRELVELVLRSLEAELRVVVILFYLEEQSLKDISLALEIPEGTVKSRLNTARQRMNDLLVKKGVKL